MDETTLLLIGGCNGAGKSTLARKLLPEYGITRFLNADEIARGLSPLDSTATALKAGRLLINEARELIDGKSSFALESTLSGKGHARLLESAKTAGFRIVLHYVSIESADQAIERGRLRVGLGGHQVPPEDIRRRFTRSRELLFELYLPLANEWGAWENAIPPARRIAENENCNLEELRRMFESTNLMESAEPKLSVHSERVLKASREATEEMLEYYRRMGVKVTPQMTLAEDQGELNLPRGVL